MALLITLKILFQLYLLLHQFPSLHSSAYTPPNKYFINCGSDSNTTFGHNRVFIGDLKPSSLPINPGKSEHARATNLSSDIPELYHTARVYTLPAWYEFAVDQDGMYLVRLHFFSFPFSGSELSKARFNVFLPGYTLLSNFTTQNSTNTPLIKEFLLDIKVRRFGIYFEPFINSSFAFVNAIEIFLAPDYLIPTETEAINSSAGNNSRFNPLSLVSKAIKTIYRINVGGSPITPENDTLWRIWVPDDNFLISPEAAENSAKFQGKIEYGPNITEYSAPDDVYRTAKVMKANNGGEQKFSSVSWGFKVSKKTSYFARVHFCDVSKNVGYFQFNFFISTTLIDTVNPYKITHGFVIPFYYNLAVVSDDSGFLNISISLNNDSNIKSALLNGLEIFELINKSGSGLVLTEEKQKGKVLRNCLIGVAVFAFLGILIGLIYIYSKGKKTKFNQALRVPFYARSRSYSRSSDKNPILALNPDINISLRIPFEEIEAATQNFNEKLVIGAGGFGQVYEANYRGRKVAVKRSQPGHGQGISEFQTEVVVLQQIKHRHLVSFIGYCDDNSEMILVYEFMENGTLRDHLYSSKADSDEPVSRSEFSWKQRLQICIDAAKGLDYLHSETAGGFIHRDVKTTNILLDKDNVAKVGDFGLSKSALPDPDEIIAGLMGSFGYLDPEYCLTGQVTAKSDVYAFGVVLLEVVSARPAIWTTASGERKTLAEFGKKCHRRGEVEKITDFSLLGTIKQESLRIFLQTAINCLKETGSERPRMHEVVYDLQYAFNLQQAPKLREPFDDSIVSGPLEFSPRIVQRVDSGNVSFLEEDETNNGGFVCDSSDANVCAVLSRLHASSPREDNKSCAAVGGIGEAVPIRSSTFLK